MKHECERTKQVMAGLKAACSDCENIAPPLELLSGKMYLTFTADRIVRGRKKQVEIPVLLSHCPFCGEKYDCKEGRTDEKATFHCSQENEARYFDRVQEHKHEAGRISPDY